MRRLACFYNTTCVAILCLLAANTVFAADVLRVGVETAPTTLDPRYATGAASARILRLTAMPLVRTQADGSLAPAMAARWNNDDDQKFTFYLKEGLVYADGEPVSAQSVVDYLNHLRAPETASPLAGYLADVDRVFVENDRVLKIHLKKKSPWFLFGMSDVFIVNKSQLGSGEWVVMRHDANGDVLLVKRGGEQQMLLKTVKNPLVRVMKLENDELDVAYNDLPPELFHYGTGHGLDGVTAPAASYTYIGFNMADGLTARADVRKALALAIDAEAMRAHLLQGLATPALSLMLPEHGAFWPAPQRYDVAAAEAALDAAGFPRGADGDRFTLTLSVTTNPFIARVAQVIQQQLALVGVKVQLRTSEWGTFYGNIKQGNFQAYILSWVGQFRSDIYHSIFHSSQIPPQGANRGRLADAEMDEALDRLMYAPTEKERFSAAQDVQERQAELLPYVPLWRRYHVLLMRPNIEGCQLQADGGYEGLTLCRKK